MHEKYTMTISSDTNLIFLVALKIAGFFISFFFYIQDNISQFRNTYCYYSVLAFC